MGLINKQTVPLLGVWRMEESVEELLTLLDRPEEQADFLRRVTAEGRRREHLASRVLLKQLMGEEPLVAYRSSGAPFLVDQPLYVSITHTQGYAAAILSPSPTGIDIEYRSDRVLRIRSRFMTQEEERGIDPAHEVEHLLIHWCAKETLFKLIDQEEVDFLTHLHVHPFPYADHGFFQVSECRTPQSQTFPLAYQVTSDYVLTWLDSRSADASLGRSDKGEVMP